MYSVRYRAIFSRNKIFKGLIQIDAEKNTKKDDNDNTVDEEVIDANWC